MDVRRLLERAAIEARFAATVLQARGPGIALTPPHRLPGLARAIEAYGPIGAAVAIPAATQPTRVAIRDERGDLTFGDLDGWANRLANALRRKGFRAGDTLGVLTRNHRGLFIAVLAGAKAGARIVLLNTDFAGPQLADVCAREDVRVLVHDSEFGEAAAGVLAATVTADSAGAAGSLDVLCADESARAPTRPARKPRLVLLTSGTTGTPKGAPREIALSLVIPGGYLSRIPLRSGRPVLLAAPAFHAWGLLSAMLALGLGNTLILSRHVDPGEVVTTLAQQRCDALITVPVLLDRIVRVIERRHLDLAALRVIAVSGAALPPELARRTMAACGDVLYNLYGSTEVAYATIATPDDLRAAPGTAGRPPPGTTVKLLDARGSEVPPGRTGRIFVGSTIQFEGYTGGGGKPVVDGLMATGDLGHLDEHGRLFVEGRDDDMIVSGGENVFPAEIEELLARHGRIREAAVVGVPDPDFGQRLRAYVVRTDEDLDEDAVRAYVKANLARYKVPREVVFVAELPRNPAGKVVKRALPS